MPFVTQPYEAPELYPQSPLQNPSRQRPRSRLSFRRDDSDSDLSSLLEAGPWAAPVGAEYSMGSQGFPQSPLSIPSRYRPRWMPRGDSDTDLSAILDGAPAGESRECPQSPISFPSRRRPFSRNENGEFLELIDERFAPAAAGLSGDVVFV